MKLIRAALLITSVLALGCVSAWSQQTTGVPGSPNATTTIDGKYLPPPPPKFGGEINLSARDSKPYWPPQVVPPKGAPNVLLIMTDDAGYGVSGTFGGVIPTPTLDRIASMGLRYTQFHSTALCSPTRAALITGRNHHSVGFGVVSEQATGYPGYDSIIGPDNATVGDDPEGERLRHVVVRQEPQHAELPDTARQARSTNGRSAWASTTSTGSWAARPTSGRRISSATRPRSFRGSASPATTSSPTWPTTPSSTCRKLNAAAPDKPFFVYYVPGGTHAPHQPTPEWIDKFKGKFDMGWNAMREQIFANQKRLGVIPANTQLTPWPDDLPKWETLDADSKKLFARQAEVFAAYVAYTDHEIGRVIQAVEDMGKLDNTLIIYISGDNGTSAEGTTLGTPNELTSPSGHPCSGRRADEVLRRLGLRQDLSAHVGGVVLGVRHAVQMDQAGGVALRRHAPGHGDGVARTASRTRAASAPSSTT